MAKYEWEKLGITWSMEKVARQAGSNATDKVYWPTPAPILVISDPLKFVAEHGDKGMEIIVSRLNGESIRVASQRKCRDALSKSVKMTTPAELEAFKEEQYASIILGARSQAVARVVEKVVHTLPNGEKYEGQDEMEYRQLFVLALVEMGVPNEVATAKAQAASW